MSITRPADTDRYARFPRLASPILTLFTMVALAALGLTRPAVAAEVTATFTPHAPGSTVSIDYTAWDGLLKTYVTTDKSGLNWVDYKSFKQNGHAALKSYIVALQKIQPTKLDRSEQFAFWANLYNAKTIDIVLDHYPVKSIKDISLEGGVFDFLKKSVGAGGPWKTKVLTVSGTKISLDDIEHGILRPIFKDPRVHYAVNCASIGCPNLDRSAFTKATLESQLDDGARAYINHPRGITVDGKSVTASSIYNWFKSDFGGNEAGVLAHVRKYASDSLKAKLKNVSSINGYGYDWALNDTARR